jgi:hypothetical protein
MGGNIVAAIIAVAADWSSFCARPAVLSLWRVRYGFDEDRVHVRVEEVKSLVDPPKSAVDLRFRGRT